MRQQHMNSEFAETNVIRSVKTVCLSTG